MNTIELKDILRGCAERAKRNEPVSVDARARMFVAMLSGSLEQHDKPLSDLLFATVIDGAVDA